MTKYLYQTSDRWVYDRWVYVPPVLHTVFGFRKTAKNYTYAVKTELSRDLDNSLDHPKYRLLQLFVKYLNLNMIEIPRELKMLRFSVRTLPRKTLLDLARGQQACLERNIRLCGDVAMQEFISLFLPPQEWWETCIDPETLTYRLDFYQGV